jgi:hypothetical protein
LTWDFPVDLVAHYSNRADIADDLARTLVLLQKAQVGGKVELDGASDRSASRPDLGSSSGGSRLRRSSCS